MLRSMYAGVSGLQNHQLRMDTIGNNIANVNTTGFKASQVNFADALSQTLQGASAPAADGTRGGTNAMQVGLGMNVASIDVEQTQGNLENTGNMSDCAIQGDGFFVLSDGTQDYYTRAGSFNVDSDGTMVNPSDGLMVQGWLASNTGVLNTNTQMTNVKLPMDQTIAPKATTSITYGGNLDSDLNGDLTFPDVSASDINGNVATVQFSLVGIGFNQYQWTASTNGTGAFVPANANTGVITLNNAGTVTGAMPANLTVTPNGGVPTVINLPAIAAANGGSMTSFIPSSQTVPFPGFNPAGPLPETSANIPILDSAGNTANVTITLSTPGVPVWPAAGTYNWAINAGANTALAGLPIPNSGTINWDGVSQFSGATGSAEIQQTVSGLNIQFGAPVSGTTTPTLQVTGKEGTTAGTFKMAQPMTNITTVYDSLGINHTFTTTFTKTATNNWAWATTDEAGVNIGNGVLTFNQAGQLISAPPAHINYNPLNGAAPMSVTPGYTGVTQYAGGVVNWSDPSYDPTIAKTEVTSPTQNGYTSGQLQNYTVDTTGTITGVFTNGVSQPLAQMAMANFTNPGGLTQSGSTLFLQSNNSGDPQIGIAGENGAGTVTPGALEMSNVDLSTEFTDMIVTERGFDANSKIITTSDQMLQELVNLKQ